MTTQRDWTGNRASTYATLGASNHTDTERQEHDYYATDPIAIKMLKQTPFFDGVKSVWEPACGGGHLANAIKELGYPVYATDLYDYGYENAKTGIDFLTTSATDADAIITNPPYKYALEFCQHCADIGVPKFAMFLKLTFLEGQKRQAFFKVHPPRYVAVCVNRVQCALNGDATMFTKSSAACYAWFIWEANFKGKPEILWLERP